MTGSPGKYHIKFINIDARATFTDIVQVLLLSAFNKCFLMGLQLNGFIQVFSLKDLL